MIYFLCVLIWSRRTIPPWPCRLSVVVSNGLERLPSSSRSVWYFLQGHQEVIGRQQGCFQVSFLAKAAANFADVLHSDSFPSTNTASRWGDRPPRALKLLHPRRLLRIRSCGPTQETHVHAHPSPGRFTSGEAVVTLLEAHPDTPSYMIGINENNITRVPLMNTSTNCGVENGSERMTCCNADAQCCHSNKREGFRKGDVVAGSRIRGGVIWVLSYIAAGRGANFTGKKGVASFINCPLRAAIDIS